MLMGLEFKRGAFAHGFRSTKDMNEKQGLEMKIAQVDEKSMRGPIHFSKGNEGTLVPKTLRPAESATVRGERASQKAL
jgi:hypothetical protein